MDRLVQIKLNSQQIHKLNSIFVEIHPHGKKNFEIGQSLIFLESVTVGTSFGIYAGNFIPSIGSYSFSHSPFFELIPFDIGNYVSIGEQVCSFGFEHPIDNLGTSPLFYQKNRNLFKRVDINTSKKTINNKGETVNMRGKGRHDPCVVPRAVPIIEAMAALVLADFTLLNRTIKK